MNRRLFFFVSVLLTLALVFTACAAPVAAPAAPAEGGEAAATEAAPAEGGEAAGRPLHRRPVQQLCGQRMAHADDPADGGCQRADIMDAGLTADLVIESADTDAQGQIQQIQNLVNKGVDAIIINPGDVNALNPTLEDVDCPGHPGHCRRPGNLRATA